MCLEADATFSYKAVPIIDCKDEYLDEILRKLPKEDYMDIKKNVEWNCKTQLLIFLKEINILDISEYEQPYSEMEPIFHINFKSF